VVFRAEADQDGPVQLNLYSLLGEQVFQTTFNGGREGYLWRLTNQTGSPVASGLYLYVLRFTKDGQPVTSAGKVTVLH